MAYEKGKRAWLHRGRGADNGGRPGKAKTGKAKPKKAETGMVKAKTTKTAKTGVVKGTAPKEQTTRQSQKEQEKKRLVPFLESFGEEPVMVTVTFGEGKDAGR